MLTGWMPSSIRGPLYLPRCFQLAGCLLPVWHLPLLVSTHQFMILDCSGIPNQVGGPGLTRVCMLRRVRPICTALLSPVKAPQTPTNAPEPDTVHTPKVNDIFMPELGLSGGVGPLVLPFFPRHASCDVFT